MDVNEELKFQKKIGGGVGIGSGGRVGGQVGNE